MRDDLLKMQQQHALEMQKVSYMHQLFIIMKLMFLMFLMSVECAAERRQQQIAATACTQRAKGKLHAQWH